MKTCYYELLGVERKATEDEVKKAYKKMALKLHPDKNHDDPDATKKFQELNEAFQVLSDANERAWYDEHRTQILSGKQMGEDADEESFGFNIWEYFVQSCFKGFNDNAGGYYHVYEDVFVQILEEEEQARLEDYNKEESLPSYMDAPRFGNSQSSDADVQRFYDYWENFISSKNFAWADEHRTSKDYERRVNRMIDQDNKKSRQKEKKKYLDTIRQLVEYVKKRDPRVERMKERAKQLEEERRLLKLEKEEEKKKQKKENLLRAREEEQRRFEELDSLKQQTKKPIVMEEEEEEEEFYCAPCRKGFKSQNQLANHEKSKQHLKAVKDLLSEVAMDEEQHIVEGVQKELERLEQIKGEADHQTKGKKKKSKKKKRAAANKQDSESDDEEEPEDTPREKPAAPEPKTGPAEDPKAGADPEEEPGDSPADEPRPDQEPRGEQAGEMAEEANEANEANEAKPEEKAPGQEEEEEDEEERLRSFLGSKNKKKKAKEQAKKPAPTQPAKPAPAAKPDKPAEKPDKPKPEAADKKKPKPAKVEEEMGDKPIEDYDENNADSTGGTSRLVGNYFR